MKKYNITVNGNSYEVMVEEVSAEGATPVAAPAPVAAPKAAAPAPKAAPAAPKAQSGAAGAVKVTSPMPGTILEVKVSVGQAVKKGDVVCVLEAMKMENEIPAPEDGTVASVNIQKGASVNAGDLLVSLN
ncbi:MAG TPA: acetyl-CoA carboxylase biotin carboxyl carrier protein subunit [Clostridiales bacterium]|nr:acetyl-CoA carboxylase biotin carboxyl carrier protein subunit [Clostridiales bacterium]